MSEMIFKQPESYEETSSIEREDGLRLIDFATPQKGSIVLDLGCGTGNLTKVLADCVGPAGRVIAIDPDIERLKLAELKYSTSNVKFMEGSAYSIPTNSYDLIYSNHVLHWCKNRDLIFEQVAANLKPGGVFAYTCVKKHNVPIDAFSPDARKAFQNLGSFITNEEAQQLAATYKFKTIKNTTHMCSHVFKDASDFIKFFMIHMRGEFDETHFNAQKMAESNTLSNGDVIFQYPVITSVLLK